MGTWVRKGTRLSPTNNRPWDINVLSLRIENEQVNLSGKMGQALNGNLFILKNCWGNWGWGWGGG